jgi:hypothetical protein
MKVVLAAAGAYNLAWGAFVVLFPAALFRWAGMEPPTPIAVWQCVGMLIGAYGIGFAIAATDPFRHWPIVLVGLIGKTSSMIGLAWYTSRGDLPAILGWNALASDLVWCVPFVLILVGARGRAPSAPRSGSLPAATGARE